MILALPWIPLLSAFLILFVPSNQQKFLKTIALASSGACFAIVFWHFFHFDASIIGPQFNHRFEWLPALGIGYQVGLDGINMTLCLLHGLVSFAGAFVACSQKNRLKDYLFFYLILVGAIYGVFTVLDLFFLYLFYEMTLIPLYPMIGIWGSKNKEYGAMKLTIFITAGAVLALFGILLLYRAIGFESFDLIKIHEILKTNPLDLHSQKIIAGLSL